MLVPAQFSVLYIVSFFIITVGFIMFNAVPTLSAVPDGAGQQAPDAAVDPAADRLLAAGGDAQRTGSVVMFTPL